MPKGENLEKRYENVKISTTNFFLTFVREDVISSRSLSNDNLKNFSFAACINMRSVQRERDTTDYSSSSSQVRPVIVVKRSK